MTTNGSSRLGAARTATTRSIEGAAASGLQHHVDAWLGRGTCPPTLGTRDHERGLRMMLEGVALYIDGQTSWKQPMQDDAHGKLVNGMLGALAKAALGPTGRMDSATLQSLVGDLCIAYEEARVEKGVA